MRCDPRLLRLLAALILACCLTSCSSRAVRPSSELEPLRVECEQGRTPDGPDWPADWLEHGPGFAIAWLGIATEERKLRAIEHACLQQLRDKGLIR